MYEFMSPLGGMLQTSKGCRSGYPQKNSIAFGLPKGRAFFDNDSVSHVISRTVPSVRDAPIDAQFTTFSFSLETPTAVVRRLTIQEAASCSCRTFSRFES